MGFLNGKRVLIVGVASQRSIASGIADAHAPGRMRGMKVAEVVAHELKKLDGR